ncbi:MAG: hypothetical protein LBQ68_03075, partial [Clostridiales bacterium]|nr:hypothetical protein [Clostridiales bacterium]
MSLENYDEPGNIDEPRIFEIRAPRLPLFRKILSLTAMVIILGLAVYLLRFSLSAIVSPQLYIELAARNTFNHLGREMEIFISANPVLHHA